MVDAEWLEQTRRANRARLGIGRGSAVRGLGESPGERILSSFRSSQDRAMVARPPESGLAKAFLVGAGVVAAVGVVVAAVAAYRSR